MVVVEVDVLDLVLVPLSVLNGHLAVSMLADVLLLVEVEERRLNSPHVAEEDGEFHCEAFGDSCRRSHSHMIVRWDFLNLFQRFHPWVLEEELPFGF